METDTEGRKIFECRNRNIFDGTEDGGKEGAFIRYGKTFYEYDDKGRVVRTVSYHT